jgi:tetratricopeptide (TPR) repeat protein
LDIRLKLDEAICITIHEFDERKVDKYILRHYEVEIVIAMAELYARDGESGKAIHLLKKLAEGVKKNHVDEREKAVSLSPIFYNLTNYLGLSGNYEETLKICDEAMEICIKNNVSWELPLFAFNKACALHFLNRLDECEKLLRQAYYGCQLMGMDYFFPVIEDVIVNVMKMEISWFN